MTRLPEMLLFKKTFKRKFISFPLYKKSESPMARHLLQKNVRINSIITLWLEFRGQLYVKYDLPYAVIVNVQLKKITERYKDTPIRRGGH